MEKEFGKMVNIIYVNEKMVYFMEKEKYIIRMEILNMNGDFINGKFEGYGQFY